jgi:hypothetical protein
MDAAETKPAPTLPNRARRTATLWILAIVVLGLLLFVTKERAPSHAGRSAESWLRDVVFSITFPPNPTASPIQVRDFIQHGQTLQKEAIEAFDQMGPAGVQFLVEALEHQNSRWYPIALALHSRLPNPIKRHVPEPVNRVYLAGAASTVLMNLNDTEPEATFRQLVALLESPNPNTRWNSWVLVFRYSEKYKPLNLTSYETQFRSALGDTNGWIRAHAVLTMLQGGMADSEMIPALSPALASGDSNLSNMVEVLIRLLEKLPAK